MDSPLLFSNDIVTNSLKAASDFLLQNASPGSLVSNQDHIKLLIWTVAQKFNKLCEADAQHPFDVLQRSDNATFEHVDALAVAALIGNERLVRRLVSAGNDPKKESRLFGFPPANAAAEGHIDVFTILLPGIQSLDTRARQESLRDVFCVASARGHMDIVRYFLKDSGLVPFTDFSLQRAMNVATVNDHIDVLDTLRVHFPMAFAKAQDLSLRVACRCGRTRAVTFFLDHGASPYTAPKDNKSALYHAAAFGSAAIVSRIITSKAEKTVTESKRDRFTHFGVAIYRGHMAVVDLFEHWGLTPTLVHRRTCEEAARRGELEGLRYILSRPGHFERYGGVALHVAAEWGHEDVVRWLVEQGVNVDVDIKSGSLRSPIKKAVVWGQRHVVDALLELGAKDVHLTESGEVGWSVKDPLPQDKGDKRMN